MSPFLHCGMFVVPCSYKFYHRNTRSKIVIGYFLLPFTRVNIIYFNVGHTNFFLDLPLAVQIPGVMQNKCMLLRLKNYMKYFNNYIKHIPLWQTFLKKKKDKRNNETFQRPEQVKYNFLRCNQRKQIETLTGYK